MFIHIDIIATNAHPYRPPAMWLDDQTLTIVTQKLIIAQGLRLAGLMLPPAAIKREFRPITPVHIFQTTHPPPLRWNSVSQFLGFE
ncbi:hypothetical protein BaRGS_00016139 [Batillaria attramentaria]|uniref:Uncharacterized protein n=1 Tax=Batillaria attramentaria TaxID=370345 RepID=A0ABD0KZY0_9CAEN